MGGSKFWSFCDNVIVECPLFTYLTSFYLVQLARLSNNIQQISNYYPTILL